MQHFTEGLAVGNVVMRLVLAHDSRLEMLQEVSMGYFEANDIAFPVRVLCVAFL